MAHSAIAKGIGLVGLVLLIGCLISPTSPYPAQRIGTEFFVVIDPRFTSQDKQEIETAIERWNVVLSGRVSFRLRAQDVQIDAERVDVDLIAYDVELPGGIGREYLAFTDRVGGRIISLIPRRIYRSHFDLEEITLHEIGHVLGLRDDNRAGGHLMSAPVTEMSLCIDLHTVQMIAAEFDWDAGQMRPEC